MTKAAGFPLQERWDSMSQHDKSKILRQRGAITWQLSRVHFSKIGSLAEDDDGFQIKTCLCRSLVTHDRHELEDIDRGPYLTVDDYFKAVASAFSENARYLYTTSTAFLRRFRSRMSILNSHSSEMQWIDGITLSPLARRSTPRRTGWTT